MEKENPNFQQQGQEQEELSKITTGGATENNLQKQIPQIPIVPATPPVTLNDVKNIDELYDVYLKGKKVEWPLWIRETKEDKVDIFPQKLFIHIINNFHILSVNSGNNKGIKLYLYNNEKGCYELWTESQAKAFIKSFLPIEIRNPWHWERVYKELTTENVNTEESQLNANEDIINFKNGILNIKTGELLPHDPKYLSTIQIPCNYIKNAKLPQARETLKFLQDITNRNADDMFTILEVIGLIISNVAGWRFKKLLILKGEGDTGKSTMREFVTFLVGEENTVAVSIRKLHSQFGAADICGKRLIRRWRLRIY